MTDELYEAKYRLLGSEFDQYILEHPDFAAGIPSSALIVFLDATDPGFSKWSLARARQHTEIDDEPGRPVVYVEIHRAEASEKHIVKQVLDGIELAEFNQLLNQFIERQGPNAMSFEALDQAAREQSKAPQPRSP
jgi:hypothetical protein